MAAGLGTRMNSALPKHLHPILGRRMVDWVLAAAQELELARVVVVASVSTADLFPGLDVAVQERPLGTGDAVRAARELLEGQVDEILVLSGDTPLLTSALLGRLGETQRWPVRHAAQVAQGRMGETVARPPPSSSPTSSCPRIRPSATGSAPSAA